MTVLRSIIRRALVLLFALVTLLVVGSDTPARAAELPDDLASNPLPADTGNSNVERAHTRLQREGKSMTLILVSRHSTGLEREIYYDLRQRGYRATTGPDEGFDTRGEPCFPGCVYVPIQDVNAISVDTWTRVLHHEYQHVIQAMNNPTMASDFRDADGIFTPYAAFSEACADYTTNVARMYRAKERMDQVNRGVGNDQQTLVDQACDGHRSAYQDLVDLYNENMGSSSAFEELFPAYR